MFCCCNLNKLRIFIDNHEKLVTNFYSLTFSIIHNVRKFVFKQYVPPYCESAYGLLLLTVIGTSLTRMSAPIAVTSSSLLRRIDNSCHHSTDIISYDYRAFVKHFFRG